MYKRKKSDDLRSCDVTDAKNSLLLDLRNQILESRNEEMIIEVNKLRDQIIEKQQENNMLSDKIVELQTNLGDKSIQIMELNSKLQKLDVEIQNISHSNKTGIDSLDDLTIRYNSLLKNYSEMELKVISNFENITDSNLGQKQLDFSHSNIIPNKFSEANRQILYLYEENDKLKKELEKLQCEIKSVQNSNTKLNKIINDSNYIDLINRFSSSKNPQDISAQIITDLPTIEFHPNYDSIPTIDLPIQLDNLDINELNTKIVDIQTLNLDLHRQNQIFKSIFSILRQCPHSNFFTKSKLREIENLLKQIISKSNESENPSGNNFSKLLQSNMCDLKKEINNDQKTSSLRTLQPIHNYPSQVIYPDIDIKKIEYSDESCDIPKYRQLIERLKEQNEKYKELYHSYHKRYRNIVSQITGYYIDFNFNDSMIKIKNIYSENDDDYLMFQLDDNKMHIYSTNLLKKYADQIKHDVSVYKSVPLLLSDINILLYHQSIVN